MTPADIWRSAKLYIDQYGLLAEFRAGERAAELKAAGDQAGVAVWVAIFNAIEELRRTEIRPGEKVQWLGHQNRRMSTMPRRPESANDHHLETLRGW